MLASWETEDFKREKQALNIASKIAIVIPLADKYGEDEPEMWSCALEMLSWAL